MIDRSTAWKYLSQRPGRTIVAARLYYGDGTAYLPVASGPLTLAGEDYLPVIKTIPKYGQRVDPWTKRHSVADMKLQLINLEIDRNTRLSDLLETKGAGADLGFENRRADVRLWKKGITSWADCFEMFPNGLIKNTPHSRESMAVEIEDKTGLLLRKMEFDLVSDSDAADTDQGLPEESKGMIRPYVGGNRRYNLFSRYKSTDTASREHNLTPCVYLGQDSADYHYWLISDHIINQLDLYKFWGWCGILRRHVQMITLVTIVQNTAAGCIIKHPNSPSFIDIWHGKGTVTPATQGAQAQVQDEAQTIDKDFASPCIISVFINDGVGDYAKITVPYPDYDGQDIDNAYISSVRPYLYGRLIYGGGAGDGDFEVTYEGEALLDDQYPTFARGYPEDHSRKTNALAGTKANIAASSEIKLEKQIAAGLEYASFCIYEAFKVIILNLGNVLPMAFGSYGAEYDDNWIDGRSTGDTNPNTGVNYTATHEDDDGDGDLIENPAGSLENLIRLTGAGDGDIDMDLFNHYSIDVTALKAAPAIIKQPHNYPNLLAKHSQQFRGFHWWGPDGLIKAKALKDDYSSADIVIPAHMFRGLKFGRSETKRLYTAVKVRYNYSHGDGRFLSVTSVASDATAQTRYNVSQAQSLLTFDAPDVQDLTTAEAIRDYLLANWMNIHNIAEGYLPGMFLHVDICDTFEISEMDYLVRGKDITASYAIVGQNIRPYWWVYEIERTNELWLKAFQIHELD